MLVLSQGNEETEFSLSKPSFNRG